MTAGDDPTEEVTKLLSETEAAHGVYETTELNGVYDQAWPAWYAASAVEHGIGALVGHPVTADRLAQLLASTFADFKKIEPTPSEGWAAYTARRITAELQNQQQRPAGVTDAKAHRQRVPDPRRGHAGTGRSQ